MNAIVGQVLSSVLGSYVDTDTLQSLSVSGLAEVVTLDNLTVKPDAIDALLNNPEDATQSTIIWKVKYGCIRKLRLRIPGGATRLLGCVLAGTSVPAIVLEIDGLFILVDKQINTPADAAVRQAALRKVALVTDIEFYMHRLLDLVSKEIAKTSSGPSASFTKRLLESLLDKLQLSVSNVHVRYEDAEATPGHAFAFGLTLSQFETQGSASASEPVVGGEHTFSRRGSMAHLAAYWDDMTAAQSLARLVPALGRKSTGTLSQLHEAFQAGIATLLNKDSHSTLHNYILSPETTSADPAITTDLRLKTGAAMKVEAHLVIARLALAISKQQVADMMGFGRYLRETAYNNLQHQLRTLDVPMSSAIGSPGQWWKYSAKFVARLKMRSSVGAFSPRWDFARMKDALADRQAHLEAFGHLLQMQYNAVRTAARTNAAPAVIDRAALAAVEDIESRLALCQVRQYRAQARVLFEKIEVPTISAAIDRDDKAQSWLSSWWSQPTPQPASLRPDLAAMSGLSGVDIEGMHQALASDVSGATKMSLSVQLSRASFSVHDSPSDSILAARFGGMAHIDTDGSSQKATIQCESFRVYDLATPRTAYPKIVEVIGGTDSPASATSRSSASQPVFYITIGKTARTGYTIEAKSCPLQIVAAPVCLRKLVQFYVQPGLKDVSVAISQQLKAVGQKTAVDVYSMLLAHVPIHISASLRAPTLILPSSLEVPNSAAVVVDFGDFTLSSGTAPSDEVRDAPAIPLAASKVNVHSVSVYYQHEGITSQRDVILAPFEASCDLVSQLRNHDLPTEVEASFELVADCRCHALKVTAPASFEQFVSHTMSKLKDLMEIADVLGASAAGDGSSATRRIEAGSGLRVVASLLLDEAQIALDLGNGPALETISLTLRKLVCNATKQDSLMVSFGVQSVHALYERKGTSHPHPFFSIEELADAGIHGTVDAGKRLATASVGHITLHVSPSIVQRCQACMCFATRLISSNDLSKSATAAPTAIAKSAATDFAPEPGQGAWDIELSLAETSAIVSAKVGEAPADYSCTVRKLQATLTSGVWKVDSSGFSITRAAETVLGCAGILSCSVTEASGLVSVDVQGKDVYVVCPLLHVQQFIVATATLLDPILPSSIPPTQANPLSCEERTDIMRGSLSRKVVTQVVRTYFIRVSTFSFHSHRSNFHIKTENTRICVEGSAIPLLLSEKRCELDITTNDDTGAVVTVHIAPVEMHATPSLLADVDAAIQLVSNIQEASTNGQEVSTPSRGGFTVHAVVAAVAVSASADTLPGPTSIVLRVTAICADIASRTAQLAAKASISGIACECQQNTIVTSLVPATLPAEPSIMLQYHAGVAQQSADVAITGVRLGISPAMADGCMCVVQAFLTAFATMKNRSEVALASSTTTTVATKGTFTFNAIHAMVQDDALMDSLSLSMSGTLQADDTKISFSAMQALLQHTSTGRTVDVCSLGNFSGQMELGAGMPYKVVASGDSAQIHGVASTASFLSKVVTQTLSHEAIAALLRHNEKPGEPASLKEGKNVHPLQLDLTVGLLGLTVANSVGEPHAFQLSGHQVVVAMSSTKATVSIRDLASVIDDKKFTWAADLALATTMEGSETRINISNPVHISVGVKELGLLARTGTALVSAFQPLAPMAVTEEAPACARAQNVHVNFEALTVTTWDQAQQVTATLRGVSGLISIDNGSVMMDASAAFAYATSAALTSPPVSLPLLYVTTLGTDTFMTPEEVLRVVSAQPSTAPPAVGFTLKDNMVKVTAPLISYRHVQGSVHEFVNVIISLVNALTAGAPIPTLPGDSRLDIFKSAMGRVKALDVVVRLEDNVTLSQPCLDVSAASATLDHVISCEGLQLVTHLLAINDGDVTPSLEKGLRLQAFEEYDKLTINLQRTVLLYRHEALLDYVMSMVDEFVQLKSGTADEKAMELLVHGEDIRVLLPSHSGSQITEAHVLELPKAQLVLGGNVSSQHLWRASCEHAALAHLDTKLTAIQDIVVTQAVTTDTTIDVAIGEASYHESIDKLLDVFADVQQALASWEVWSLQLPFQPQKRPMDALAQGVATVGVGHHTSMSSFQCSICAAFRLNLDSAGTAHFDRRNVSKPICTHCHKAITSASQQELQRIFDMSTDSGDFEAPQVVDPGAPFKVTVSVRKITATLATEKHATEVTASACRFSLSRAEGNTETCLALGQLDVRCQIAGSIALVPVARLSAVPGGDAILFTMSENPNDASISVGEVVCLLDPSLALAVGNCVRPIRRHTHRPLPQLCVRNLSKSLFQHSEHPELKHGYVQSLKAMINNFVLLLTTDHRGDRAASCVVRASASATYVQSARTTYTAVVLGETAPSQLELPDRADRLACVMRIQPVAQELTCTVAGVSMLIHNKRATVDSWTVADKAAKCISPFPLTIKGSSLQHRTICEDWSFSSAWTSSPLAASRHLDLKHCLALKGPRPTRNCIGVELPQDVVVSASATDVKMFLALQAALQAALHSMALEPRGNRQAAEHERTSGASIDYDVIFPTGCSLGLTLNHSVLKSGFQLLQVDLVKAAAKPMQYNCGGGVNTYHEYPATRAGIIQSGDLLISINGNPLAGLTVEQAVDAIQRSQHPRKLRFRPISYEIALSARQLHLLLVHASGIERVPRVRAHLSNIAVAFSAAVPHFSMHATSDDFAATAAAGWWVPGASAEVSVVAFNDRNVSWEPLVEPFVAGAEIAMMSLPLLSSHGDISERCQRLTRIAVTPVRVNASTSLLSGAYGALKTSYELSESVDDSAIADLITTAYKQFAAEGRQFGIIPRVSPRQLHFVIKNDCGLKMRITFRRQPDQASTAIALCAVEEGGLISASASGDALEVQQGHEVGFDVNGAQIVTNEVGGFGRTSVPDVLVAFEGLPGLLALTQWDQPSTICTFPVEGSGTSVVTVPLPVCVETAVVEGRFVATLKSTRYIRNHTAVPLEVLVSNSKLSPARSIGIVEAGSILAVPLFESLTNFVALAPTGTSSQYQQSEYVHFAPDSVREICCQPTSLSTGDADKMFFLWSVQDEETGRYRSLHVHPPVVFKNQLPCTLMLKCKAVGDGNSVELRLTPGESFPASQFSCGRLSRHTNLGLACSARTETFDSESVFQVLPGEDSVSVISVASPSAGKAPGAVFLEISRRLDAFSQPAGVQITFFVPFWIVNQTRTPLIFADRYDDGAAAMSLIAPAKCRLPNAETLALGGAAALPLVTQSVYLMAQQSLDAKLALGTKFGMAAEAVDLTNVRVSQHIAVPTSSDGQAAFADVTAFVTPAPPEFPRTMFVFLRPQFLLVNASEAELLFRYYRSVQSISLPPLSTSPLVRPQVPQPGSMMPYDKVQFATEMSPDSWSSPLSVQVTAQSAVVPLRIVHLDEHPIVLDGFGGSTAKAASIISVRVENSPDWAGCTLVLVDVQATKMRPPRASLLQPEVANEIERLRAEESGKLAAFSLAFKGIPTVALVNKTNCVLAVEQSSESSAGGIDVQYVDVLSVCPLGVAGFNERVLLVRAMSTTSGRFTAGRPCVVDLDKPNELFVVYADAGQKLCVKIVYSGTSTVVGVFDISECNVPPSSQSTIPLAVIAGRRDILNFSADEARVSSGSAAASRIPDESHYLQRVWDEDVQVGMESLQISVVDDKPTEICNLAIHQLQLKALLQDQTSRGFILARRIQLDDMARKPFFPVVALVSSPQDVPSSSCISLRASVEGDMANPQRGRNSSVICNQFVFDVSPVHLAVSLAFLKKCSLITSRFESAFGAHESRSSADAAKLTLQQQLALQNALALRPMHRAWTSAASKVNPSDSTALQENAIRLMSIDTTSRLFYISSSRVSDLHLKLSYAPGTDAEGANAGLDVFDGVPVLHAFAQSGIKIKDASLRLRLPQPTKFVSASDYAAAAAAELPEQFLALLPELLLSIDAKLNPLKLLKGFGGGAITIADGIANASLADTATGVGQAVRSAAGTAAGVTDLVGGVMSVFSEDATKQRKKAAANRPTDMLDGVAKGAKEASMGLFNGVTGIFTKPVHGYNRSGIGGAVGGLAQGVLGAVLSPAAGILGGATRVLEGVEAGVTPNAADVEGHGRAVPVDDRVRPPRVFHGKQAVMTPVDVGECKLWDLVVRLQPALLEHAHYLYSCSLQNGEMLLTERNLIILTTTTVPPRVELAARISDMESAVQTSSLVEVFMRRDVQRISLRCRTAADAHTVHQQLMDVISPP